MDRRMYEAAVEGDVISLRNLLLEDKLALDRFIVGCYAETPLHIACMLGHTEFVQEILIQKPELTRELDSRNASPLHLATAKGFLDIVKRLVSVNPDMCFARDQDGKNPLHIASMKGHVSVLRELVRMRSHATSSLMDHGETILHFCVKYNLLEAMKCLVEEINNPEFVNSKDKDGNTILHLAVVDKQVEAVKFLTRSGKIEVNALNAIHITAMDILKQTIKDLKYWEIEEALRQAGAISATDFALAAHELGTAQTNRSRITSDEKGKIRKDLVKEDWLEKKRNALMVVASLMATMSFQAGLTPPGGLWQDNSKAISPSNDLGPHEAGSSIMASYDFFLYDIFIVSNTISFGASLSIILLLISGLPFVKRRFFMAILTVIMWVAVVAMGLTYVLGITALTNSSTIYSAREIAQFVWLGLIAILLLGHVIRFIVGLIKFLKKRRRRQ